MKSESATSCVRVRHDDHLHVLRYVLSAGQGWRIKQVDRNATRLRDFIYELRVQGGYGQEPERSLLVSTSGPLPMAMSVWRQYVSARIDLSVNSKSPDLGTADRLTQTLACRFAEAVAIWSRSKTEESTIGSITGQFDCDASWQIMAQEIGEVFDDDTVFDRDSTSDSPVLQPGTALDRFDGMLVPDIVFSLRSDSPTTVLLGESYLPFIREFVRYQTERSVAPELMIALGTSETFGSQAMIEQGTFFGIVRGLKDGEVAIGNSGRLPSAEDATVLRRIVSSRLQFSEYCDSLLELCPSYPNHLAASRLGFVTSTDRGASAVPASESRRKPGSDSISVPVDPVLAGEMRRMTVAIQQLSMEVERLSIDLATARDSFEVGIRELMKSKKRAGRSFRTNKGGGHVV